MATKRLKNKVPRMLKFDEYKNCKPSEFNKHHDVYIRKFTEVQGYIASTHEEAYKLYQNWYFLKYTKLGQILK